MPQHTASTQNQSVPTGGILRAVGALEVALGLALLVFAMCVGAYAAHHRYITDTPTHGWFDFSEVMLMVSATALCVSMAPLLGGAAARAVGRILATPNTTVLPEQVDARELQVEPAPGGAPTGNREQHNRKRALLAWSATGVITPAIAFVLAPIFPLFFELAVRSHGGSALKLVIAVAGTSVAISAVVLAIGVCTAKIGYSGR